MLSSIRKKAHPQHDVNISGLLLTLSIKIGLKQLTDKLRQPAAKFAHFAFTELKPIDSKIETE